MNAFNDVNIAGACILTNTEFAERMGISREKWIFPLGGGRAEDSKDCKGLFKQDFDPLLSIKIHINGGSQKSKIHFVLAHRSSQ